MQTCLKLVSKNGQIISKSCSLRLYNTHFGWKTERNRGGRYGWHTWQETKGRALGENKKVKAKRVERGRTENANAKKKLRDICPIELVQRFSGTLFSRHKMQQFSQCKPVQTMQRKNATFLVGKLGICCTLSDTLWCVCVCVCWRCDHFFLRKGRKRARKKTKKISGARFARAVFLQVFRGPFISRGRGTHKRQPPTFSQMEPIHPLVPRT